MLVILAKVVTAASSSGRSLDDWGYDVSKNVASAAFVALLVAVAGKAIGFEALARVRWRVLLTTVSALLAILSLGFLRITVWGVWLPIIEYVMGVSTVLLFAWSWGTGWLEPRTVEPEPEPPPPPVAESYWDAYWAVRRGNPVR
jgi:hypothetical protein